jgi:hypothetical protein
MEFDNKLHLIFLFLFILDIGIDVYQCQDIYLEESISIKGNGTVESDYIGLIVYNNTTNMSVINITSEGLKL